MIYLKWFFIAVLNLFYTTYAWIVAPRIARKVDDNWLLPFELRDYQTPDAFMNGMGFGGLGRGGDRDFFERHLNVDKITTATEWQRRNTYHGGRCWKWGIEYGNIISHRPNGIDYNVFNDSVFLGYCERKSGNFTFDNRSGEGSFLYHFIRDEKVQAFMYYSNIHFRIPFLGEKRLRMKLGWDLWTSSYWQKDTPRMFVCSLGIHRTK